MAPAVRWDDALRDELVGKVGDVLIESPGPRWRILVVVRGFRYLDFQAAILEQDQFPELYHVSEVVA